MIKINIGKEILNEHIKYIATQSKVYDDIQELKEKAFFTDNYINMMEENSNGFKEYWKKLKTLLGGDLSNKNIKEILNKEHRSFMEYILKNILELTIFEHNNLQISKNNMFMAKPKDLNTVINYIEDKFKYLSLIFKIEKNFKYKVLYSNSIIEAIGYAKFSSKDLIKIKDVYDEFFKKIYSVKHFDQVCTNLIHEGIIENKKYDEHTLELIMDKLVSEIKIFRDSGIIKSKSEKDALSSILRDIKKIQLTENGKSIGKGKFINKLKILINSQIYKLKVLNTGYVVNIDNISDYDKIFGTSWSAYKFLMKLGIKVCPYCNRQYITPLYCDNGKVRADLDHFYPKYIYPYLSMSIYNLVPSCKFCNSSLKNGKEFSYNNNLNPYEYGFSKLYTFSYDIIEENGLVNEDNLKIILKDNSKTKEERSIVGKAQNNNDIFQLENIYNFHKNEVSDLIKKKMIYTDKNIEILLKEYKNLFESKEQVIEFLIGGYSNKEEEYSNKILSKLVNDIRNELDKDQGILNSNELKILEKFINENK
ncbi:hypothetical protein [Clostridium butyricum]|uniref:hypothetical protein n=1 Tax=Clostridium butyricum TaxID=1492 RepID=UPI00374E943D